MPKFNVDVTMLEVEADDEEAAFQQVDKLFDWLEGEGHIGHYEMLEGAATPTPPDMLNSDDLDREIAFADAAIDYDDPATVDWAQRLHAERDRRRHVPA